MRFYNIERSHRFVGKTLVEIKEVDKTYYVKGFSGKILGEIKSVCISMVHSNILSVRRE